MFKKPFKLKSQVQLKSSEKKKLSNEIKKFFPVLTDEEISSISGSKENISRLRLVTFKEENVEVIIVDKVPLFFEIQQDNSIILPTVFMAWRFPHALPHFTTNKYVLDKLKNGANLFFPGVIMEGLAFTQIDFKSNDAVAINLIDNKAAVSIGQSVLNKSDIFLNKQNGLAVVVFHHAGDHLFKLHSEPILPKLGAPDWVRNYVILLDKMSGFTNLYIFKNVFSFF